MKIYISGPMTGRPDFNHPAFHAAAATLRAAGWAVFNPAENGLQPDAQWGVHMRVDIKALMDCDAIVLLDGWMDSKGARLERHIAVQLGMRVYVLQELLDDAGRAAV